MAAQAAAANARRKRPGSPPAAEQALAYRALMGHDPPLLDGPLVWQWKYRGGRQRLVVEQALLKDAPHRGEQFGLLDR